MEKTWPRRYVLGTATALALGTTASVAVGKGLFQPPRMDALAAPAPSAVPSPVPEPMPTPVPTVPPTIEPSPTSTATMALPLTSGVTVTVPAPIATVLGIDSRALTSDLLAALHGVSNAVFAPDGQHPAVAVTLGDAPTGWQRISLRRIPLVPVISPRLAVPMLPADQLAAVLDGTVTHWGALGATTDPPIELVMLAPLTQVGDARLVAPLERTVATVDDLVSACHARAGGLCFLPLPALTPQLTSLPIGSMDAASGHGPLDAYPLTINLIASVAPDAPVGTADAVRLWAQNQTSPPSFDVLMLGDIIQGRTVHKRMEAMGDWQLPFRSVASFTAAADLTLADNECDYSDTLPNPVDRDPMTFSFITKTAAIDGLTLAGIDGVTLANNHSMNMGRQGLLDTITALDARGIVHTGAAADLASARQPALFTVKGVRIALLGYNGVSADADGATSTGAGTVPLDMDILTADMALAKMRAQIVIPFFHWGVEYTSVPTPEQVRFARAAVEMGASIVIGSHPHWVQATEIYKSVPIIYSLGNYVFDQEWSIETKQGAMVDLQFLGDRLLGFRLIPILITDFSTPHIATPSEAMPILSRIWDATDTLATHGI